MAELSPAFTVSSNYSFGGPYTGASASGGAGMRDGNSAAANTVWAGDDVNDWIRADLTSAKMVEKIGVAPINSSFDGWGPSYLDGAKIQSASSSGGPWTDRATLSGHADGVTKEYAIGVSARYWRLSATGFQLGVGEFRIYELDPVINGAASLTTADATPSSAAKVALAAALAATLGAATLSSAGGPKVTAAAAITTGAATSAAAGASPIVGQANLSTDAATVSATIESGNVEGTADLATAPATASAAGALRLFGGSSLTTAGATASSTSALPIASTFAGTAANATVSALGTSPRHAAATVTLDGATIAAEGDLTVLVITPPGRRMSFNASGLGGRTIPFDTARRSGRTVTL